LEPYDVIVVGSGAGGGMSAYVLAHAGLKVLMLEAGRDYDPAAETPMFNIPSEAPLSGAPTPDKPMGFYDATVDGGWVVPNEPYTVAEGSDFRWWRARMLGGRTNHWTRVCLRFGPYDFKPYSRDGLGFDWPITYEDLAPWYDKVERLIGVTGLPHGLENTPDTPPGIWLPPPPPRPSEYFVKRGFESMGIPVAAIRAAILTQSLNGRPACYFATPCIHGCAIGANFQTPTVLIPPALATGNLKIRTNALVYQVDLDKSGRAAGVTFADRESGEHHSLRARAVVLAASSCESARILLNSKSALFPDGLANESGLVGRYLMDSVSTETFAQFPALERLPPRNDDGISTCHIFVPWWGYAEQAGKKLDFPRGYHIQLSTGRKMPNVNRRIYSQFCEAPYGIPLRDEIRRKYGSYVAFTGLGEMIPNDLSFCEINPTVTDKWGIPVLRFHWRWSEHETRQAAHMRKTFGEVVGRLGGTVLLGAAPDSDKAIYPGGFMNHEVGGVRMGSSAKDSVVNQFGQSWSVDNLFVADGGVFVSNPDKNPTLTIMALSWRSGAYLAEEARKGNL
jgi:choline dehydrogenase-like flavoprotein